MAFRGRQETNAHMEKSLGDVLISSRCKSGKGGKGKCKGAFKGCKGGQRIKNSSQADKCNKVGKGSKDMREEQGEGNSKRGTAEKEQRGDSRARQRGGSRDRGSRAGAVLTPTLEELCSSANTPPGVRLSPLLRLNTSSPGVGYTDLLLRAAHVLSSNASSDSGAAVLSNAPNLLLEHGKETEREQDRSQGTLLGKYGLGNQVMTPVRGSTIMYTGKITAVLTTKPPHTYKIKFADDDPAAHADIHKEQDIEHRLEGILMLLLFNSDCCFCSFSPRKL
jgi:hypothetical protein